MTLLFETICIQHSKPLHLQWHIKRMENAIRVLFPGMELPDLEPIKNQAAKLSPSEIYRCRLIYGPGHYSVQFQPYTYRSIKTLKILTSDAEYSFKYLDRKTINDLYAMRGDCDDILIIKDGHIRDTNIANIIFRSGRKLYTPSTPLLKGTTIERLREAGEVEPIEIKINDLKFFDAFWTVNALRSAFRPDFQPIDGIKF